MVVWYLTLFSFTQFIQTSSRDSSLKDVKVIRLDWVPGSNWLTTVPGVLSSFDVVVVVVVVYLFVAFPVSQNVCRGPLPWNEESPCLCQSENKQSGIAMHHFAKKTNIWLGIGWVCCKMIMQLLTAKTTLLNCQTGWMSPRDFFRIV